ncbi:MAG: sigma-70 family RNA polymerase sigma factor [Planctomycetaceae bacterium]
MTHDERSTTHDPAAPADGSEFVPLFTRCQRSLYLFILAQVPSPTDAEEILQETNLVLWRKFDQFQPGTNFSAWASQVARYEVLKFRERRGRERLCFSDDLVQRIAEEAPIDLEELDLRRQALAKCLGKLRKSDRELIQQRYAPGTTGKTLARALGRPANSVYQSLGRIRRTLLECVNRQLAAEAGS